MKKLLTALLAAVLCLTGCGGDKGATYDTEVFKDFFVKTSGEITTWNYLSQGATVNARVLVNVVSGLLETDKYGKIVGDLAETWTHNGRLLQPVQAPVWQVHSSQVLRSLQEKQSSLTDVNISHTVVWARSRLCSRALRIATSRIWRQTSRSLFQRES